MTAAEPPARRVLSWVCLTALATLVGVGLMVDTLRRNSATYDEAAYLQVAATWWRTGSQERIARMGSPLLFWKLQQAPVLWLLDRSGFGGWIDDPVRHEAELLPLVRLGALWIWVVAQLLTAGWAAWRHGPKAMAAAAWLFALSPNLLGHGSLVTMELPLVASSAAVFLFFWRFLATGRRRWLWGSAAACGVAFSCKFTAILFPPLLGLTWLIEDWRQDRGSPARRLGPIALVMAGYLVVMFLTDFALGPSALIPLSEAQGFHPTIEQSVRTEPWKALAGRLVELPIPQDWAGFLRQVEHQHGGGSSYLLGERRQDGWWYYYLVCLAVKLPLSFMLLVLARIWLGRFVSRRPGDLLAPVVVIGMLAIVSLGSSRNYGFRYLLPLAPLVIVWLSGLAQFPERGGRVLLVGIAGQALAVALIHPCELSYFNILAGGPTGGRVILADSNLDWGQGALRLARLQRVRPEFRDLTVYYFGDSDPSGYGVIGTIHVVDASQDHPRLPRTLAASTRYVAVSASLEHGPWGPDGYFDRLKAARPVWVLEDATIAIFRAADIPGLQPGVETIAQGASL